jgi:hypothetical protein
MADGRDTGYLEGGHDGSCPRTSQMQQKTHRHEPPDQQFADFYTQGSSRVHAGNLYVEQQNNYYASRPTINEANLSLQHALAFPEMGLRSVNIPSAQPQTCGWLFKSAGYKRWLDPASRSKHHGILWLKGKPGAGKSTLMKAALKHARATQPSGKLISFFFNARGQGLEKSTEGMYRALLHQVSLDVETLPDMVEPTMMATFQKKGWPLELLKELFRETLLWFGDKGGLTCYIDALDECDEDAIRDMLALFEELADEATLDHLGFSVCFASRHYPNIKVKYREEMILDDIKAHHDDISLYVQRRLNVHDTDHRRDLSNEIMQRSSGVFMWVVLVVAILNKFDDRGDVHNLRARLREIPPNLQELFDDILSRDGPNENLVPIMQWSLFSGRPMSATELYYAVMMSRNQLDKATLKLDKIMLNGRTLHNFIITSSKGFLGAKDSDLDEIDRRNVSYELIHESVREYFLAHGLKKLDPDLGTDAIGASHARLARSCAAYINIFPTIHPGTWTDLPMYPWNDPRKSYPFLKYVHDFGLFYHANAAAARGYLPHDVYSNVSLNKWWTLRPLDRPLSRRKQPRARNPANDSSEELRLRARLSAMRRDATLLHILVDCGFTHLVLRELQRHLTDESLSTQRYVDTECGLLGTALHIAVHHGDARTIQILLTAGAERDVRSKVLGTPKDYAILLKDTNAINALGGHDTSNDVSTTGYTTELTPDSGADRLGIPKEGYLLHRSALRRRLRQQDAPFDPFLEV